MTEGNTTRTTDTTSVVRVCPLCAGTGRRRIRRPGTPRRATALVDCTCASVKGTK
jgi:ribosome-binding protein aMBF1 (putative translation factor)